MTRTVHSIAGALLITTLAACGGGTHTHDGGPMDAATAPDGGDATDAVFAEEAVATVDVPPVIRCGPEAVPWPDDAGACSAAMPMPDGGPPLPGQCSATVNSPVGTLMANQMDGDALVIPSGRRIQLASNRLALSGVPMSILRLPGTHFVVVSDGGFNTEHVRVVDVSASPPTVVSEQDYPRLGTVTRSPALFYGLAFDPVANVLYASGGGSNFIYAYDVAADGTLTPDMTRTIDLGLTEGQPGYTGTTLNSAYVAGLALSSDGSTLFAALDRGYALAIIPIAAPSQRQLAFFPPAPNGDGSFPYAVVTRPGDTSHVYVGLWGEMQVAEVDVNTAMVVRTFDVGKNPEEMLFSADGSLLYVAASDSDAISVVDLSMMSAPVTTTYLRGMTGLRGIEPTALAWGPNGRLYVVEAEENAVAAFDVNGTMLTPLGRIPTEWYPTDVDVDPASGDLVVITGKGSGSGPNTDPSTMAIDNLLQGSIALYPAPDATTLMAGDMTVTRDNDVMTTFNDVQCPNGAPYDFPVPRTTDGTPSTIIHHVIYVVRENKTYDSYLGDLPGGNGDPNLTVAPANEMDAVVPNLRALAGQFADGDNYYSTAEQSLQGHVHTAFGRTTDYVERTWLTTWGRATRGTPDQGVSDIGRPEEHGILGAVYAANIRSEDWGEIVGDYNASQLVGSRYPGVFFNMTVHDIQKALAFGDWVQGTDNGGTNPQRRCQLATFTYILLPNDHTSGTAPGKPTPRSYIQDTDEATGFLVDAVSHSVFWPDTLIAVIEDDPGDVGDHVDNHRSIVFLISPWVRHGYVSHVHYDESSLLRTLELVLGVAPTNQSIANAAPMYDLFTSTPDFTPFRYTPRRECEVLNPGTGGGAASESGGDFSTPDNVPGLGRIVWESMHPGRHAPWRSSPVVEDDDDDNR